MPDRVKRDRAQPAGQKSALFPVSYTHLDVYKRQVVGTAAVRVGGPSSPPHHPDLGRRYADRSSVAQLLRVITAPEVRRRGVARRLAVSYTHLDVYKRQVTLWPTM